MATETTEAPPFFPPGRYGRRRVPRRPNRLARIIAAGLALGLGLMITALLYQRHGKPAYQARVVGYDATDRSAMVITIEVVVNDRSPARARATCRIRALASDGATIGSADLPLPPGDLVRLTHRLPVSGVAKAIADPVCHAE